MTLALNIYLKEAEDSNLDPWAIPDLPEGRATRLLYYRVQRTPSDQPITFASDSPGADLSYTVVEVDPTATVEPTIGRSETPGAAMYFTHSQGFLPNTARQEGPIDAVLVSEGLSAVAFTRPFVEPIIPSNFLIRVSDLFSVTFGTLTGGQNTELQSVLSDLEKVAPEDKRELVELLSLPPNWDLEGGQPAARAAAIAAAKAILQIYESGRRKPVLTSLSAGIDGGIEMTWEGTEGRELFIVIPPNGQQLRYVYSEPSARGEYIDSGGVLGQKRTLESLVHDLVA